MAYTKLHHSMLASTIWLEPDATRLLWITLLCLASKDGEIMASVPGLARIAGISREACEVGLASLCSPDPDSRSTEFEGRRLEKIPGGWLLLNFDKYREEGSKSDSKEKNAERVRRWRARQKARAESNALRNEVMHTVTHDRDIAEAEVQPKNPPLGSASPNGGDSPDWDGADGKIPEFKTPGLRDAWREWLAYRRSIGRPLTFPSRVELARKLDALHPAVASETIRNAIANGYIGLTPPKTSPPRAPVVEDPEPIPEITGGRDPREILRERKAAKAKS